MRIGVSVELEVVLDLRLHVVFRFVGNGSGQADASGLPQRIRKLLHILREKVLVNLVDYHESESVRFGLEVMFYFGGRGTVHDTLGRQIELLVNLFVHVLISFC